MHYRTGGAQLIVPGLDLWQGGGEVAAAAWWMAAGVTPVAVYQPKGAADLAASYVNLANPGTYDAAPGVAPTFATGSGWTFNGSTTYLLTGIVPGSGWSMLASFSSASGGNTIMGSTRSGANFYMKPRNSGQTSREYDYGSGDLSAGAAVTSGTIGLAHTACYYNGASDGVSDDGTFSNTPYAIHLASRNGGGGGDSIWTGVLHAAVIWDETLDAGQMSDMHDAISAL